jgi:hypothetical protein
LIAVLAVTLVACGGGDDKKAEKAAAPAGSTLEVTAGDVTVQAAGAPGILSDEDKGKIANTLRRYIIAATIEPLHGKPVGNLTKVFTPEAATSLAGLAGGAVVDDGMPKAITTVKASTPPVPLTALSDPSGAIDLVGATLFLDVRTKAAGGPVRVQRNGELVLRRDGGDWKIASYKLTVDRTGSGIPVPTSNATESTTP